MPLEIGLLKKKKNLILVNGIFARWQTFEPHVISHFFCLFSFEIEVKKKQTIIVHD